MKKNVVQSNFLSGVLDPRASARVEADAYNNGVLTGHNVELHHLGGLRRRRGQQYKAKLPYVLSRETTIVPTAPNGGTAANATDNNPSTVVTTTTPPNTTNNYVVVQLDLGSSQLIDFFDVLGIRSAGGSSTEFRAQWSDDGVSWNNIVPSDGPIDFALVDVSARDYRLDGPYTGRYFRVVRVGVSNLPFNVTIAGFNLWKQTTTLSNVRTIPFEISNEIRLLVALTDRAAAIFENGALVAILPMPYESEDIPDIDADASEGEMVLTHPDYPTRVLFDDDAGNYQSLPVEFTAIPQVDFADSLSPTPTSEVQVITLAGSWAQGATFQVGLMGARSAQINFAGDSSAPERESTAADIARQIQKMYTVKGFDGVTVSRTGALTYTVTFADASADTYELMTVTQLPSGGTATVTRSQAGVSRAEDVWSSTRGWPCTVAYFERRLYFGGSRSKPQSIFGSHVVDTLNFELAEGLDDEAIFITLSGQQTNIITGICAGRYLQIFTTGGEFRYVKRDGEAITPGDVPKNQTQYGTARIRPVAIDGATVYVHSTRKAIRDFKFDYQEDAFNSLALSSLAPHLLNDIVGLAAWNGSRQDELSYVFVVNGDGTIALMNLRREAEVKALLSWSTQGYYRAVGCVREDVYLAVERTIGGVPGLYLEQLQYDYYTDCARKWTPGTSESIIVGLDHLSGTEVRIRADAFVLGRYTPISGQINLTEGEFSEFEVGLDFNPEVTPMPLQLMTAAGSDFMSKRRIVDVRCRVRGTLGLLVNGRPLADRAFDINYFDQAPAPFTGVHKLEETTNWDETEDKLVTFSQVDPLPFELLGITVKMESE
jgi:hypothetical protein